MDLWYIKKNILIYVLFALSFLTIGLGNLNSLPFSISQLVVIIGFLVLLIHGLYKKDIVVPKVILMFYFYIILSTFVINGRYFSIQNFKSMIGLLIYFLFYYWLIKINSLDLVNLIKFFLKVIYIISIIALLQEIGYLFEVRFLYDYSFLGYSVNNITTFNSLLRVYSIATEPASLSVILLPGIYFSIYTLKYKNYNFLRNHQCIVIILAMILTFSLVGYFNSFLIFIYFIIVKEKKYSKKIIMFSLGFLFILFVIIYFEPIRVRILNIINIRKYYNDNSITKRYSVFALVSNFLVTIKSLKHTGFFGIGFGNHIINYNRYIYDFFASENIIFKLNKTNAASLYLRFLSELGIVGFVFGIYILLKYKIKSLKNDSIILINEMAFLGLIGYQVRMGNYLHPFFLFMLALYIYTYILYRKNRG